MRKYLVPFVASKLLGFISNTFAVPEVSDFVD